MHSADQVRAGGVPAGAERFRAPRGPGAGAGRARRRAAGWLLGVAAAYVAVQFAVLVWRGGVAWDEALYISQVSPRIPAGYFSAPRARGITYLVAPVTWLTGSVTALRAYLAVLSGVAIGAAFWPWLRLGSRAAVAPLAALVFAGLWVTGFYGSSAMPNFWVAVAAVATVGWFLRCADSRHWGPLVGVGAWAAAMTLMRPHDAFWTALPLAAAALAVRPLRRLAPLAVLAGGLALGLVQWIAEAFTRFGGPLERLHRASETEGGLGWHPRGLLYELHALNGPQLCRPCVAGWRDHGLTVWWFAVPALVVGGVALALRARRNTAVAAACGIVVAASYLLLVDYAAPRFLLPAYALLAVPVAEFFVALPARAGRWRAPVLVAVGAVLAAHLVSQQLVLVKMGERYTTGRMRYARTAAELRGLGFRAPCLLAGPAAVPVAFYAGCRTGQTGGNNASMTTAELVAAAGRMRTGVLSRSTRPPAFAPTWKRHRLPGLGRRWAVYSPE
ncbi:hypothetical protein [Actinomadura atramentaria]|uniref:hypothetical protein n=1 Tax=Actinomadura atramentaria TaxID=1990 RepID=UPI0003807AD1|nr:hypothetical protein [Actinomadura atramentaria]